MTGVRTSQARALFALTLWARLRRRHKSISRYLGVVLSNWQLACRFPDKWNEAFWIVVPAIGVTGLMASIVLLLGR